MAKHQDVAFVARVVDGDAASIFRGEDQLGSEAIVCCVYMSADDIQSVVEHIYAGDTRIIGEGVLIETEIESAVVGSSHATVLARAVDGVGAFVEVDILLELSLCGDPCNPQPIMFVIAFPSEKQGFVF